MKRKGERAEAWATNLYESDEDLRPTINLSVCPRREPPMRLVGVVI